MTSPDVRADRKSLHNAQRAIIEAYSNLASGLQLPEKDARPLEGEQAPPPRPAAAPVREAAAPRRGVRARAWIPAVAVLLCAGILGAWMLNGPSRDVPKALIGTWSTTHADFAGREVVIGADSITLRNVLAGSSTHAITRVQQSVVEGARHVAISYEEGGGLQRLELVMPTDGAAGFSLARPKGVTWQHPSR